MFIHISEVLEAKHARLQELARINKIEREVQKELEEEGEQLALFRKVNHAQIKIK